MEGLLHVVSPVTLETADKLSQGKNGRVLIKTKPLDGVQSVDGVGEGDELDTNQREVGTAVVNIPLSFQATTDERREQRTGAKLDDIPVVEEEKENGILSPHAEMKSEKLFELRKRQRHKVSHRACWC